MTSPVKNPETWPYDADQYFLFNVAVLPSIGPDFTASSLEVDYIRVYQEKTTSTVQLSNSRLVTFPNPFNKTITVNLPAQVAGWHQIDLLNLSGKLIRRYAVEIVTGTASIDGLGNLPAGSYLLRCEVDADIYQAIVVKQ